MTPNTTTLCAVGDVRILEHTPHEILQFVEPTLKAADISFCQLENAYSSRGNVQAGIAFRASPDQAKGLKDAGFDVISTAGNHCMDYGHEALIDTVEILGRNGLLAIGTGKNLKEASKPAIVEHNGTKIGFLAFNSIMPDQAWAEEDRPGCNAIRIQSADGKFYTGETASPRRPDIEARKDDIEAMQRMVKELKRQVDVVVASFHWGLSFSAKDLAPYQSVVGHAAIDAGADLVLGHHPHILKAVEIYKGKVLFYSIGNFAFDHSKPLSANAQRLSPNYSVDPEYPGYVFAADSRKTIMVKCTITDRKIARVAVLPTYINGQAQPQPLKRQDPRFPQVVDYLKEVSAHHGMNLECTLDGDEAVLWSAR